jgi:AcrR family transcriptional regulator
MAQPSNRDNLLKGAMKCLRTKGYAHTTARDIAAASGANLASIGYHFGSKESLLNEALIKMFRQRNWKVGAEAIDGDHASTLDRLRAIFVGAGKVFEAPRPVFVAFLEAIAQAGRSPDLREPLADFYRDARKGIAVTIRSLLGPDGAKLGREAEVMGTLLMALFDGLVLQWVLDPDEAPTGEELFDALAVTMRIALEAEKRPSRTRKAVARV